MWSPLTNCSRETPREDRRRKVTPGIESREESGEMEGMTLEIRKTVEQQTGYEEGETKIARAREQERKRERGREGGRE